MTAADRSRVDAAWAAIAGVPDPEVPVLSVVDLGIVRDVVDRGGDGVEVVLTPTYSGCPATEVIAADVRRAVESAGIAPVTVTRRLAPAWTTDWISDEGRRRLHAAGIAPPGRAADAAAAATVSFHARRPDRPRCPRCGSANTETLSAFGSTACKSLHRCRDCREPFEHVKAI